MLWYLVLETSFSMLMLLLAVAHGLPSLHQQQVQHGGLDLDQEGDYDDGDANEQDVVDVGGC